MGEFQYISCFKINLFSVQKQKKKKKKKNLFSVHALGHKRENFRHFILCLDLYVSAFMLIKAFKLMHLNDHKCYVVHIYNLCTYETSRLPNLSRFGLLKKKNTTETIAL
jgi:hypothetical protein